MKILIISDLIPVGGSATYLKNVVQTFVSEGNQLSLIGFSENFDFKFSFQKLDFFEVINIKRFGSLHPFFMTERTLKLYFVLKKFFRENQIECVLVDLIFPAFSLILLRYFFRVSLKNVKFIYQFHGLDPLETHFDDHQLGFQYYVMKLKKKLRIRINIWILNTLPDKIIVFSQYARNLLLNHNIKTKIQQIIPGVEKDLQISVSHISKELAREKLGLSKKTRIVLIVSRLESRKGVLNFFKNLPNSSKLENLIFLVASDFANEGNTYSFFKILEEQYLTVCVHSISKPTRLNLGLLYKAADLTLMPSLDLETFGFVTLESMSVGTPVIGFNIGANPEIIDSDLLVDNHFPKQLTNKMWQMLEMNKSTSKQLELKIVNSTKKYTWKKYVKKIESLVYQN